MAYAGTWLNTTNSQIPNATNPQPYLLTNEAGASASLNFRGRAVSVNGATDDGSGTYQVVREAYAVFIRALTNQRPTGAQWTELY